MRPHFFLLMLLTLPAAASAERPVLGAREHVRIENVEGLHRARIDSGAFLSSINARVVGIEKDATGRETVTFDFIDDRGNATRLQEPVVRYTSIKKKAGHGDDTAGMITRPVIRMPFCIAGKTVHSEVSLADRGNFTYAVLVGRDMLRLGDFVIDAKRDYVGTPECG